MTATKPTTISELYEALVGDIGDLKIGSHAIMLRFDHTDTLLDVIATTVNRHEEILNEHSKVLNQHTTEFIKINQKLDQHEELLDTIGTTVNHHDIHLNSIINHLDHIDGHLNNIDGKLDHHEELLDTLAEQSLHQTKILDRLDPQISLHDQRLGTVERSVARLEFAK